MLSFRGAVREDRFQNLKNFALGERDIEDKKIDAAWIGCLRDEYSTLSSPRGPHYAIFI
jgi:hypothetical protein